MWLSATQTVACGGVCSSCAPLPNSLPSALESILYTWGFAGVEIERKLCTRHLFVSQQSQNKPHSLGKLKPRAYERLAELSPRLAPPKYTILTDRVDSPRTLAVQHGVGVRALFQWVAFRGEGGLSQWLTSAEWVCNLPVTHRDHHVGRSACYHYRTGRCSSSDSPRLSQTIAFFLSYRSDATPTGRRMDAARDASALCLWEAW